MFTYRRQGYIRRGFFETEDEHSGCVSRLANCQEPPLPAQRDACSSLYALSARPRLGGFRVVVETIPRLPQRDPASAIVRLWS